MNKLKMLIGGWLHAVVGLRTLFAWWRGWGVCLCGPASFARYDENGSEYGPYNLWFERVCWPIYKAVAPPAKQTGWTLL